ncbi:MAG: flagellar motor protein MotD [Sinimarinibacterium sp.]|jgi:chemotaxis protein MotB
MAKKHKHEDHTNHEAWAIPYGDLITLLLAFFVVMYAVSSVNEGKYRVLADSLSTALGGPPKSLKPVQIGDKPDKGPKTDSDFNAVRMKGFPQEGSSIQPHVPGEPAGEEARRSAAADKGMENLRRMANAVQQAMQGLIDQKLVLVRRTDQWLEIEINTDILFASGVAEVATTAAPVLADLAGILGQFPNQLRIEGHTDNVPISTPTFPSNWELSATRAASVVHLFMQAGVDPARMTVIGLGEYHPVADNRSAEGRNRNRRVVVVVMGDAAEQREVVQELPPTLGADAGVVVVPAGTLGSAENEGGAQ